MAAGLSYARIGGNAENTTTVNFLGRDIQGRSAALGRDVLRFGGQLDLSTSAGHNWFAAYGGSFQQGAASHSVSVGAAVIARLTAGAGRCEPSR